MFWLQTTVAIKLGITIFPLIQVQFNDNGSYHFNEYPNLGIIEMVTAILISYVSRKTITAIVTVISTD